MTTQLQNFYKTTITRNWTATTGDFNVSVKPTVSSGYLVVSPNNATLREIIKYTATGTNAYGDFVRVSNIADRGVGGTSAQTHTIGETVRMNITAEHWQEMIDDIDSIVAAGASNASTTTRGIVEEATEAQIIANTTIGETSAPLFIPVDKSCGTFHKTVSISSAEILTLYTTPKELIPAPGAGLVAILEDVYMIFTPGVTQYASGGIWRINYTGQTTSLMDSSATILSAAETQGTTAIARKILVAHAANNYARANTAIEITNLTGLFTTGNGTAKIHLTYRILTL